MYRPPIADHIEITVVVARCRVCVVGRIGKWVAPYAVWPIPIVHQRFCGRQIVPDDGSAG